MHFDRVSPCGDCPFVREGHISLRPERVDEIAGNALAPEGKTFTCHKDVYAKKRIRKIDQQHCAGSLIFSLKNDNWTTLMQIASRLGILDHTRFIGEDNRKNRDRVFDTLDEMRASHEKQEPR